MDHRPIKGELLLGLQLCDPANNLDLAIHADVAFFPIFT